ncbi:hypothetical protein AMTRI_Chr03g139930 [Amborella trichopoda]|uniref:TRASH domain-containing protein n=1 Tax=Amborella trichopoda TaxID=13333 RepID=W1NTK7_AMBTC|nr:probable ribosome biogenesis protein RLP24 [Amborella trichopoda]ERN00877.1 hypothetical protein AMTR_s00103p00131250 [Amborella trichopoda]|eukprot:XP_006838308.1 probable ribosome biogenesis protein RLP24 [Amborella trichopoda]
MRLEKCWFCSSTIYPGHGIQFVRNDCTVFKFCRSKCHKNFKMKRNPRKVRWTKKYRELHNKDLARDTVFEFERKRQRPERYDRNLVENTLKAMKKIDEIRVTRREKFWLNRMKVKKSKEKKEDLKELEQGIDLVKAPLAFQEDSTLTIPKAKKMKVVITKPEEERRQMEE